MNDRPSAPPSRIPPALWLCAAAAGVILPLAFWWGAAAGPVRPIQGAGGASPRPAGTAPLAKAPPSTQSRRSVFSGSCDGQVPRSRNRRLIGTTIAVAGPIALRQGTKVLVADARGAVMVDTDGTPAPEVGAAFEGLATVDRYEGDLLHATQASRRAAR